MYPTRNKTETLASLPPTATETRMPEIRAALELLDAKVVILDDDPTGTQTAHDVTVITTWEPDVLADTLRDPSEAVFVLTNTRSMTAPDAAAVIEEIGTNLRVASAQIGRPVTVISRGDSTLRGHFPMETNELASALGVQMDGVLIVPAFMAGGRMTIDGVHYVAAGDTLVPVAQTPFAQDKAFGYANSNLREWVAEKTGTAAAQVAHISLTNIRIGGVAVVQEQLMSLSNQTYCVVDAVTEQDLEVVVLAGIAAETAGKRLLYRTAASFATIRAGITLRPPLTADELRSTRAGGGLVVVGSYVPKSSQQLDHVLQDATLKRVEVRVSALLDPTTRQGEKQRVIEMASPWLDVGETVIVYTSRELVAGDSGDASLKIGGIVSASLVEITRSLQDKARFVVAKGGITSSDIATEALQCKRALVIGQILPGVPVWALDDTSAAPDMVYVVFPGNVGGVTAIADALAKLP